MKVFWVLAWEQYYPDARLGNVRRTFETKEEADAYALEIGSSYDYVEVEDVSRRLGLTEPPGRDLDDE